MYNWYIWKVSHNFVFSLHEIIRKIRQTPTMMVVNREKKTSKTLHYCHFFQHFESFRQFWRSKFSGEVEIVTLH